MEFSGTLLFVLEVLVKIGLRAIFIRTGNFIDIEILRQSGYDSAK